MSTICLNPACKSEKTVSILPITETWTEVKVKRVWAAASAGIALAGSAVCATFAFTATLWLLAPAIPLFLSSGILIWYCCTSIDYEDPKELSKIREQAQKMTLPEITAKHGLDKLFRYSIISPKQFEKVFSAHVKKLDLNHLVSYYEEVCQILDAIDLPESTYHIPEPKLWRDKLIRETNDLQFSSVQDRYSLAMLIDYELILPSELENSFIAFANQTSLPQIVTRYENALSCLKSGFSIPTPERWKTKFAEETGHLSCSEILDSYPLNPDALVKYRILSENEWKIFTEAQKAKDTYRIQEQACKTEFEKRTEKEREICTRTKELAHQSYQANPTQAMISSLFIQYMKDVHIAEQNAQTKIDTEKARLPLLPSNPTEEDKEAHAHFKLRCENRCAEIKRRLDLEKSYLFIQYKRNKDSYERNLEEARNVRNQTCLLADEQFLLATKPAREDSGMKLAQYSEEKAKKLAEINARYDAFRSSVQQPVSLSQQAPMVYSTGP